MGSLGITRNCLLWRERTGRKTTKGQKDSQADRYKSVGCVIVEVCGGGMKIIVEDGKCGDNVGDIMKRMELMMIEIKMKELALMMELLPTLTIPLQCG